MGAEVRPDLCQSNPPAPSSTWRQVAPEVVISIAGRKHWLWRAVDSMGSFSTSWFRVAEMRPRPSACSESCSRSKARAPRVMITGKPASQAAGKQLVMPGVEHRQHRGLNNGAENSHQPTRRGEDIMKHFKSARQAAFPLGPRPSRKPLPPSCGHRCRPSTEVASTGFRDLG